MTSRAVIRLKIAAMIVACLAVYLIGNGRVALWDRDEPRYAQTSRQMLQSGDWVVPHYLDLIRTAKPALIYWCQATAMAVFGDGSFAARLPSSIAMTTVLVMLAVVLHQTIGPRRAMWTVFVFGTSGLVIAAAKMCITDAVLLIWVTAAQLCLYAVWRGNRSWAVFIIWGVMNGLAILTKGPVIFGMQATTALVLFALRFTMPRPTTTIARRARAEKSPAVVKALIAILIAVLVALPWVLLVNHRAHAFLQQAVGHDVWDRMMTPLEQHFGPPGYYLLTIWGTFFPWSILIPLALVLGWKRRHLPTHRFSLAAIIGPWLMLECVRTKLPHYLLPVFPPLAFLTADAIVRCLRGQHDDFKRPIFRSTITVWAAVVAGLGLAPWLAVRTFRPLPWGAMAGVSIAAVVYGVMVAAQFRKSRPAAGLAAMGGGMLVVFAIVFGWYLPEAEFLRLSPRTAAVLISQGATHKGDVLMFDYMEPSLAFYQGGTIREAGDKNLSAKYVDVLPEWIVVTGDAWAKASPEVRGRYELVAANRGWSYADRGRVLDVMVMRRARS